MSDVTIRLAHEDDAEQLAPLHVQVWNEAYAGLLAADVLAARAARPLADRIAVWRARVATNAVLVAEGSGGGIVGWCESGQVRDADRSGLELMSLYVVAAVYDTGIGHRLLAEAIGDAPACLWVLDGNERAIRFYLRHGFQFDGTTKDDPPYGTESRMVRLPATSQ